MAAKLLMDEFGGTAGGLQSASSPATTLADALAPEAPLLDIGISNNGTNKRFSIYHPSAAFSLIDELRHLSRRSIESNVFFDPEFLVPAMPRLDDKSVRLVVVRDETAKRSRLRLLMPFSVEKAGILGGVKTIRAWTHPFGPLGTLLVDGDDPAATLASFLTTLVEPGLTLPDILVVPDVRIEGAMAGELIKTAEALGLPVTIVNRFSRAALVKHGSVAPLWQAPLAGRRRRELGRQRRRLEAHGQVHFAVAREPGAVRAALEDFLILEAGGWKGRERSALISDRFRAAFARESINALAMDGRAWVLTLAVDGRIIASLITLIDRGEAYAWKSAYDEAFAAVSPGQLLMAEATKVLLADPTVRRADSCAVPDHFVMNRFWTERLAIGTIVVGLDAGTGRKVEAVAKGLRSMRRSRNVARIMREKLKGMIGLG